MKGEEFQSLQGVSCSTNNQSRERVSNSDTVIAQNHDGKRDRGGQGHEKKISQRWDEMGRARARAGG